jgi:hypothetical protein
MTVRSTWIIAAVLGALAAGAAIENQRSVGIARDEVVYMGTGSHYAEFWARLVTGEVGLLSAEGIHRHFGGPSATDNNREHPPLWKTLFGFSERWLHQGLGWTERITAYRVPTALAFGALVAMVFLFAASVWGTGVGLAAGLLIFLCPRQLFHAGLATFDAAVVTTWMATIFAYWRALDSRRWCWILGIAYGLALATKHNAIILPAPILAHYLIVSYLGARGEGGGFFAALWRGVRGRQPLILVALFVVGPAVLFILWPWLWLDPFGHTSGWIGFHLDHVHYNFEYLGRNWNAPPYPWHVPVVTTLVTVPAATLLAGAIGAVALVARAARGESDDAERSPGLLLFLSAGAAMGPFVLTSQPIFGAEKHWAPAIPTIAIYAGIGLALAARLVADRLSPLASRLGARLTERVAFVGLAGMVAAAALVETIDAQPYALSHYTAVAGGAPGAADLGMNRQFWGVAARGVLPVLSEYAPPPGAPPRPVYSHDAQPAWGLYRKLGLLGKGLPDAGRELGGIRRSKLALVIHERHFNRHDYLIWSAYGTLRPIFVLTTDGVPIVSVYARPGLGAGP